MYFIASNYRRNNIIMFSRNWTNNVLQNSVTNHNDDRGLPAAQSSNKDILVWCELQDLSLVCTLICWDTTTTAKFLISHHPGHLHWSYRDLPVHISNLSLDCFFIFHTFFFDKQYRFLLLFSHFSSFNVDGSSEDPDKRKYFLFVSFNVQLCLMIFFWPY